MGTRVWRPRRAPVRQLGLLAVRPDRAVIVQEHAEFGFDPSPDRTGRGPQECSAQMVTCASCSAGLQQEPTRDVVLVGKGDRMFVEQIVIALDHALAERCVREPVGRDASRRPVDHQERIRHEAHSAELALPEGEIPVLVDL